VNVFSYVQIRGSSKFWYESDNARYLRIHIVPLFWTQSGYSLKPAPQLSSSQTHEQHLAALKRHFGRTTAAYGSNVRFVRILYVNINIKSYPLDHRQFGGTSWEGRPSYECIL
jgi:hypothetical protein